MTRQWLVAAVMVGLGCGLAVAAAPATEELDGRLVAIWGDPAPGVREAGPLAWRLFPDGGGVRPVMVSPELAGAFGGARGLSGRRVHLWLAAAEAGGPPRVAAVRTLGEGGSRAVVGSHPWVSLLCKFSNVSTEPETLSYFQGMYDNAPGRLDHYWRESSYNLADVAGSTAVDWVTLPHPQTTYVPSPGSGCLDGNPDNDADLGALFADCTAAADPYVDFSNGGSGGFDGINLMFNSDLDGCAWGGGWYASLDGVDKGWSVTWEPPWGYQNVSTMAHEMGHGFGLPHSNNWDSDGWPYDNSWDVMSDSWTYTGSDPTYGGLGQHTISAHKDWLGWIPAGQKAVVTDGQQVTLTLDALAVATTGTYRMVEIPIPGSNVYWTVEARKRTGLYDGELPGDAVIIHQVDEYREEPAWCYDPTVPPDDEADNEGSMWRVGETFTDAANDIAVTVVSATANGFVVTVTSGDASGIFADGFNTGTTGAWSSTQP